jgi:hypothetical protein
MVKMQRVPGPKDPAELTYYTLYNGKPLLGTAAAKILSTIDSQRMALTLHHVVLLQADRKGRVFHSVFLMLLNVSCESKSFHKLMLMVSELNIFLFWKDLKSISYVSCVV